MKVKKRIKIENKESVGEADFLNNGASLALVGDDFGWRIYDLESGKLQKSLIEEFDNCSKIKSSPNGEYLAVAGVNVSIYSTENLTKITDLKTNTSRGFQVRSFDFLPNNKALLTLSEYDAFTYRAQLWEIPTGKLLQTYMMPNQYPYAIEAAPNGVHFVVAGIVGASEFKVYDIRSQKIVQRQELEGGTILARYTPDGKYLVYNDQEREELICFWDIEKQAESHTFRQPTGEAIFFDISPDGKMLASIAYFPQEYGAAMVYLWDIETGKAEAITEKEAWEIGNALSINHLRFSPTGDRLVICRSNGIAEVLYFE